MSLDRDLALATIGIDTLWGGDVMNPSGMGRFIADSWFSDEPLPDAYSHPAAARLRESGGVGPKEDREAVETFIREVDTRGAIDRVRDEARAMGGGRGAFLEGIGLCFDVMWDLAMELHGTGEPVPYTRCVEAILGRGPEPSDPTAKRERLRELLAAAGYSADGDEGLLEAVARWRAERMVPKKTIPSLGEAFIARFDALTVRNLLPYVPQHLAPVPRANVKFLPIENAWFSGSMNYLGRARKKDGSPEYEATYELNAALEISVPEFQQLVSHEVVPGHVTTFAYLQNLYVRKSIGFEGTILAMNTRASVLHEGIANNAILIAYGITELDQLPDRDMEIGVLLALLQDDAKNQSSYLTWGEQMPQDEVRETIRRDFLLSSERADKLSGAWGRHPLLGRMYLPAYRFGTELVADLRRKHRPEKILPILYGCNGLVDCVTILDEVK